MTEGLLSGSVDMLLSKRAILVDDVTNGLVLHDVDTGENVRTFDVQTSGDLKVRRVLFGENGKVVLGATDRGTVIVFERSDGEKLATIKHDSDDRLEMAVSKIKNQKPYVKSLFQTKTAGTRSLIAIASTSTVGRQTITVWEHNSDARRLSKKELKHEKMQKSLVMQMGCALLFVICLGYIASQGIPLSVSHAHAYSWYAS